MPLPFTRGAFFDAFGAYNTALGPAALALWVITVAVLAAAWARPGRAADRVVTLLLALHWAWSALAYHAAFFAPINPAAWLFAALFLTQAVLLARAGLARRDLRLSQPPSRWSAIGALVILYALAYPALALAGGLTLPRAPTFGVPCPTAILTLGVLLAADRAPRALVVAPLIWALVGGSAARLLDVPADFMLLAAAGLVFAKRLADRGRRVPGAHGPALT